MDPRKVPGQNPTWKHVKPPLLPGHHSPTSGTPAPQGLWLAGWVGFAFSPWEVAGGDGNEGFGEAPPRGQAGLAATSTCL